jgi:hypothetical protein
MLQPNANGIASDMDDRIKALPSEIPTLWMLLDITPFEFAERPFRSFCDIYIQTSSFIAHVGCRHI